MELSAHPVAFKNGDLIVVSFYDQQQLYGVSLSRELGQPGIELMVADQSCYELSSGQVQLSKDKMHLMLPPGTIDRVDGEDEYVVRFTECTSAEYDTLHSHLREILEGNDHVVLRCA